MSIEEIRRLKNAKNKNKGEATRQNISKTVTFQKFYEFIAKLEVKYKELGIELRIVDKNYTRTC